MGGFLQQCIFKWNQPLTGLPQVQAGWIETLPYKQIIEPFWNIMLDLVVQFAAAADTNRKVFN